MRWLSGFLLGVSAFFYLLKARVGKRSSTKNASLTDMQDIFPNCDRRVDDDYLVKEFFNSIHIQGYFVSSLRHIVKRFGVGINDEYCSFPDRNSDELDEHFDGVEFAAFTNKVIVSEAECSDYIDQACAAYLRLHPEDAAEIHEILQSRLF